MSPRLLALMVGLLLVGPALADKPRIDRSIGKQPVYESKNPKYGLLAFGPEGKDRVWLVLDGKTLYVDRNGNGDLTDPGEKVAAEKTNRPEEGTVFEVGAITVGGKTHRGLRVGLDPLRRFADSEIGKRADVKAALAKDSNAHAAVISADVEVPGIKGSSVGGRVGVMAGPIDLDGVLQFADKPADAPVVRLGGPLQVTFYADRPALRVGRESDLVLVTGTPGVGPGTFAMLLYEGTIPEAAIPVVKLTLPGAKKDDPPVMEKYELKERC